MSNPRRDFGPINAVGKILLNAECVYGDMKYSRTYSRRKFVTNKHYSAAKLLLVQELLQQVVAPGWTVEVLNWTNKGCSSGCMPGYKCVVAKLRHA